MRRRTVLTLLGSSALSGLGASNTEGKRRSMPSDVGAGVRLGSGRLSGDGAVEFTILHTNDEHSHLVPFPAVDYHPERGDLARGGFARLAERVREIRAEKRRHGEDVFLLSAGDLISGPPFGWLPLDGIAPELRLMQHLGYDAVAVGNHEFDYGPETLARYYEAGGYPEAHESMPLLGSNVDPPDGHELDTIDLHETTTLELRDGTTLGVFSLLGEDAIRVAPLTEPVEFSNQQETARRAVRHLRDAGADIVVALTHSGVEEDLALADVDGIDLVVGGHSHTALHRPLVEGDTIIVQAGHHLQYLGKLELAFDPETGALGVRNDPGETDVLLPLDSSVPEAADVREMVGAYEDALHTYVEELTGGEVTRFDDVVARSEFSLPREPSFEETPLGNFITDALRLETAAVLEDRVDFAFQADGLIRERLRPGRAAWADGEVVFYDLVTTSGLGTGHDGRPGYPVVSFWVTEDEVLRSLEISVLLSELLGSSYFLQLSGGRMEFDPNRAVWGKIPVVDTPLPAYRAITGAERYIGEGIQNDDRFEPLEGGDRLYRIATDYYVGMQIPSVGELVPRLEVEPKDRNGKPMSLEDAIVRREDGRELKVWETLVRYARNQPLDDDGTPRLSAYYRQTDDRLTKITGRPLFLKPMVGAAVAAGAIGYGIRRWRNE